MPESLTRDENAANVPNKSFFITTPIFYANAELHIGHGYTSVITDTLKRYHTLFGEESFFLTGMDEHGAKVEEAALAHARADDEARPPSRAVTAQPSGGK